MFALWASDPGGMEKKEEQKKLSVGIKWNSELFSPTPYFVDWTDAESGIFVYENWIIKEN